MQVGSLVLKLPREAEIVGQIAEPHRLLQKIAVAVIFAGQMTRLVIGEGQLRNPRDHLGHALTETVDQMGRANGADERLRETVPDIVGESVTGKRRRIGERNVSTTLRQPAFEFKLGFSAFGLAG
jgi:hypothetical protein